jgi:hypothetical protein
MTTNSSDRIARQIAALEAAKAAYSNPIMPDKVKRPAPKARRNSVRHRAIR